MAFKNYLEDENDKPYFTTNSLAYYYDKMEGFAKAVEGSAKALNLTKEEVEKRLTLYIEQNKNELDQRLADWDGKLETFDSSVETLLTEWVNDGTLTHVIDGTLIDERIAPVTAQIQLGLTVANKPSTGLNSVATQKPMITFLDDDGTSSVLTKLKPLAISKGIPFTLAIIADNMDSKTGTNGYMGLNDVQDLYKNYGFEIQSHSSSHPAIGSLATDAEQWYEIQGSYDKLNRLGFNVDYLVYPYGSNDRRAREKVSKYYKGAIGTSLGLNGTPLSTFGAKRIPMGSFTEGNNTLAYYKGKVDEAVAKGEWLIFMLHVGNAEHDAVQQQHLSDLIDYIQTTTAKVVTVKEGYETFGNMIDYDDQKFYFSKSGKNNMVNYMNIPYDPATGVEKIDGSTPPANFETNKTVSAMIYTVTGKATVPGNAGGILTVYMTQDRVYAYRTFVSSSSYYISYVSGTGWGAWKQYISTAGRLTASIPSFTLAAGAYTTKTITITRYDYVKMVLLNPKFELPTGVQHSYGLSGPNGTIKITFQNLSDVSIVIPTGEWQYLLID